MLRAVWFTPTVAQSDRGADWFRCDVIAVAGDREAGAADRLLAACWNAEAATATACAAPPSRERPTSSASSARIRSHSWRAISTCPSTARSTPARRGPQAGEEPCRRPAGAVAEDTLSFQWGYEWPTEKQWDDGQTYGRCWAPAG